MYNAQFWDKAWQDTSKAAGRRRPDPKLWQEYWSCFSSRYAEHNEANKEVHQSIIDGLIAQGAIKPGDSLLDIGCGPGTYALPLAAYKVKVTGLDTSQGMLDTLSDQAVKASLTESISVLLTDWLDIAPEPAYDITFAAKSPAINNYDSLMKMTKVARRACCLIGFAGKHDIGLRRFLWERLLNEPAPGPAFDIIYPLNILYQEGYRPNLTFSTYGQTQQEPLNYLIDHYIRYFAVMGVTGNEVENNIRCFLEGVAIDGYCAETSETTIGIMWWQV
ncbi:SAM-dependent methyltransferase [Sporomusa malonica]|uniref:Methyltransferase domain-containing protein n=1 Tax=Sporomusa malonica TaxID=112901 RepID=A0A1W2EKY8_9FIRM|nr:class I SAM-dependent methyltransferase [Sporomusa malonica]SMD09956.1 Methyltransferase domain-containing protein [Sporomusa malonica]